MRLTLKQISEAYSSVRDLSEEKFPFKLSFLLSRNLIALQKEYDFYMQQERAFIFEYLVLNEKGEIQQNLDGSFKIQDGKIDECLKARRDLDSFESEVEICKLPSSLLKNLNFTPAQLAAIDFMIEEEEEHE